MPQQQLSPLPPLTDSPFLSFRNLSGKELSPDSRGNPEYDYYGYDRYLYVPI